MNTDQGFRRRVRSLLANFALAASGVGLALVVMELLLRTFPDWVPGEVRVSPPVRRVRAFVDETYEVRLSDGDLFHWMQGAIAPLPPGEDTVEARVHLVTDAHGFRNDPPELARYRIVALGDSFTRARSVPVPWPEKLSETTGMDVLNLADDGAGPQQEVEVLREFGMARQPQWVIMAYCGANDLYDAAAYEQAEPFILARFGRYLLTRGRESWQEATPSSAQAAVETGYRYPITLRIDDADLEMAFFSAYMSWLSVSGPVIASSQDYRIVTEAILTAQALSEEGNARLLLVYIPSKENVYLPFLDDAETASRVFADVPTLAQDEAGFLTFTDQLATLELARQHSDDQADLLARFAEDYGVAFLNLTSTFQEAAGTGVELFYPFDTHWNQQGHSLAAQAIARFINDGPSRHGE